MIDDRNEIPKMQPRKEFDKERERSILDAKSVSKHMRRFRFL